MMNEKHPSREECLKMLNENETPDHVVRHCLAVTDVAIKIGAALNEHGATLDLGLIESAGLLHDIARVEKCHDEVGAEIVSEAGYTAEAEIIKKHMKHNFPNAVNALEEVDLVCLGDRMVNEDVYVGFDKRMRDVMARFSQNAEALEVIALRMNSAKMIIDDIEKKIGMTIDELIGKPKPSLSSLLLRVEKPGRYVGGELHSAKKDLSKINVRFGFAFPDLYEIGMSYHGLQIIYGLLNQVPDVYCERIFAPAADMEELLRENEMPLFTLETKTPACDMDILGFTLQYELSFSNIINMLNLSGIPILSKDRGENYPLIAAGGPCAYNPEPLADAVDFFMIGDGEELLPEVCKTYNEMKQQGADKKSVLKALSKLAGVYVPAFYKPEYDGNKAFCGMIKLEDDAPDVVKKRIVRDLDGAYSPDHPIVPLIETVHDRAVSEIFRGCTRGCRFCQAGMIYRPVREKTQTKIKKSIMKQLDCTGYDEVSILSLSTSDYSGIEVLVTNLMEECKEKNVSLSLPSLRLDSFSFKVLEEIQGYKKSGLTFAPEAGTQRLRDVINKSITDENIYSAIEQAVTLGWNHVKFYFMIGLPTETTADLDGIVDTARRTMEIARGIQEKGKRNFTLTVSVSNFVPKAHTTFQWESQNSEREFLEKNMYLKERLSKIKGVSFQYHDTRTSFLEAVFARGDRRCLDVLISAVKAGCRFDSWREHFKYDVWMEVLSDYPFLTDTSERDISGPLPWDHISSGIEKSYFLSEREKSRTQEQTEDCRLVCGNCGLSCHKEQKVGDEAI